MNFESLKYFVDPHSKESFELIKFQSENINSNVSVPYEEIKTAILIDKKSSVGYPIVRGIPRIFDGAFHLFLSDFKSFKSEILKLKLNPSSFIIPKEFKNLYLPTLSRFQKEWLNHDISNTTWGLTQDERINKLLEYLNLNKNDFKDKLYLDLGCGTGQLSCTVVKEFNCNTIGLDLSSSVEKGEIIRQSLFNRDKITFIQANLFYPPFRENSVDIIHSSGVLHHTPNTKNSFDKIQVLTKGGGKLGVWLYRKGNAKLPIIPFINPKLFGLRYEKIRKYSPKLHPSILYSIIYLYTCVFHFIFKLNTLFRGIPHPQTIKERVTSLFDSFAPTYVHKHDPEEVKQWFQTSGYCLIQETDQENTSGFNISGTKS